MGVGLWFSKNDSYLVVVVMHLAFLLFGSIGGYAKSNQSCRVCGLLALELPHAFCAGLGQAATHRRIGTAQHSHAAEQRTAQSHKGMIGKMGFCIFEGSA